jgi:hypothetical protein
MHLAWARAPSAAPRAPAPRLGPIPRVARACGADEEVVAAGELGEGARKAYALLGMGEHPSFEVVRHQGGGRPPLPQGERRIREGSSIGESHRCASGAPEASATRRSWSRCSKERRRLDVSTIRVPSAPVVGRRDVSWDHVSIWTGYASMK